MWSKPLIVLWAMVMASPVGAAPTTNSSAAQTGTFTAKFTERSLMSAPNELSKRFGEKQAVPDYDLSQHEFIVHVPADYDASKPMGVMFLLLYKDTSEPPGPCLDMLDQKRLIFIVPKEHALMPPAMRCGVVLDAIHNLKRRYAIDDGRLFLFAMYADDFTNERIALSCGDVFSGLIISEPGFYKRVPAKAAHSFWEPNFSAPPGEVLGKAKQRALILVKEKPDDFFAAVVKAFTNDGFKRVTTMQPATHETLHYPNFDPEFVRKAIEFMDAPAKPQAGATTRGK